MKKTILAIAALAAVGAVALSLFFFMQERPSDDRRDDVAYRAGLAENVEAQRSSAREAARLSPNLVSRKRNLASSSTTTSNTAWATSSLRRMSAHVRSGRLALRRMAGELRRRQNAAARKRCMRS